MTIKMKQYEFEATNRIRGNVERIRATAADAKIARRHIVNYYGSQFYIADLFCNVFPAHHVLGEIDCSDPGCDDLGMRF